MLYAGTSVAAGTATAVAVAVGPDTEAARAARAAGTGRRPSGVETRLRRLTSRTVPVALGAGLGVVGAGLVKGRPISQTLTTGVGLAVAAVPEGLPLVATVAQLASSRRLSARGALIRNHATIEALGRVDVLCADKTGTLTSGRIEVRSVSDGRREEPLDALDARGRRVVAAALRATSEATGTGHVAHPTDRAVIDGAAAVGVGRQLGSPGWRRRSELPFEPTRGYHAVLGSGTDGLTVTVKGAPEVVLPRCTRHRRATTSNALTPRGRRQVAEHVDRLARQGYRVLAVAERPARSTADLEDERVSDLELVGLLAMADPVRPSAADAVKGLGAAGVQVVMVTGDHPSTAEAIAAELGLWDGKAVLTGPELDGLSDAELETCVEDVAVFARVSPGQKVRIVEALQRRGRVVAMTGDGANDAAAIQLADVGVAIGPRATNAAKEAADVVVTDDDIETLIHAILEGRAMWASVRDAVSVLVGGNLGEIGFTLGSELLSRGGSPLNARQLLLVNLLTDLVPAMALAMRPPSGVDPATLATEGPEASLGTALNRDVLARGTVTAAAGGVALAAARLTGLGRSRAGTIALVSIVGSQLGQTLLAGWRNPLVVGSALASAGALGAVVQTPGVSHFFGCRPLGPVGWGIGASAAVGSSLAAPLVHRLLDEIQGPASALPAHSGAAPDAATAR
jgi:cation-transporting ATPase I